jgi:NAD(P)H dehydrogenase (quinone)
MAKVAVVYFSGYGHTAKQAEAVIKGAAGVAGVTVTDFRINENGDLPEGGLAGILEKCAK